MKKRKTSNENEMRTIMNHTWKKNEHKKGRGTRRITIRRRQEEQEGGGEEEAEDEEGKERKSISMPMGIFSRTR